MSYRTFARHSRSIALALLLIPLVSVLGCSTLSDSIREHAEAKAQQEEAIKTAVVAAEPVKTPDIPPHIAKCVHYGLALSKQKRAAQKGKEPSADELVLAELKTKAVREACAKAVLAYYREVQKANRKVAAK